LFQHSYLLADGSRFRIGPMAEVLLQSESLQAVRGQISELPAVPAFVELAPMQADEGEQRAAASRVRTDREAARTALEQQFQALQEPSLLVLVIGADLLLEQPAQACQDLARLEQSTAMTPETARLRDRLGCPDTSG
jgi:hypothetical protein